MLWKCDLQFLLKFISSVIVKHAVCLRFEISFKNCKRKRNSPTDNIKYFDSVLCIFCLIFCYSAILLLLWNLKIHPKLIKCYDNQLQRFLKVSVDALKDLPIFNGYTWKITFLNYNQHKIFLHFELGFQISLK